MLLRVSGGARVATWQHQYLDSHRVINVDDTQVNYGPRTWSYRTETFRTPALTKLINHPQVPAGFTQVPAGS